MKEKLTIIGTIISSLIITFVLAEIFSLYHFGAIPTTLTCIYLISLFCIWEYISLSVSYIIGKKMKKERIGIRRIVAAILFLASLLSILGFIFMVDIDWLTYYSMGNSAPFYTFVLVRCVEFLLPAIVLLTMGIILLKKINKKKSEDHIEKKMTGDVATFNMTKEDLLKAHKYSLKNRKQLEKDKKCGCFCCGMIFNPKRIKKWCHDGTALCPYCGTDSVIGESSGFPIDKSFLDAMEKYWF